MYEATFELEAVTPLFMRGADQRRAEFRSASVKGVMRWWFRALAGNYFGNDIQGLRKAECRVFGCAGSGRSRVIVEVESIEAQETYSPKNEYERYFWFSQVDRYSKGAILPNTTINLTLKSSDENILKLALLSLWVSLHLGGFGSRSRKFAGSLFPTREPESNVGIGVQFLPKKDIENFYTRTFEGNENSLYYELDESLKALGFERVTLSNEPPKYPVLAKRYSLIAVGRSEGNVGDVIKEVGKWYLGAPDGRGRFNGGFRFRHADRRIPHRIYQKYKKRERIGSIRATSERRPFLGLPIQFYKSFGEESVKFTVDHWNADRRASGLLFTVNAIRSESSVEYYPVITIFRYKFLPEYNGPVRYRGGVYKERRKVASAAGALFITDQNQGEREYVRYLHELATSLSNKFTRVYGSLEVFQ